VILLIVSQVVRIITIFHDVATVTASVVGLITDWLDELDAISLFCSRRQAIWRRQLQSLKLLASIKVFLTHLIYAVIKY